MHFSSVYRELVLFDGAAFAHIAVWEEYTRLKYLNDSSRKAIANRR